EGELLLLGLQVGDPRLERVDLVAERGHVGGLAQVEEAEADGGGDRHQHRRDAAHRATAARSAMSPRPRRRSGTRSNEGSASGDADPGRWARPDDGHLGGCGTRMELDAPGGRWLELAALVGLERSVLVDGAGRVPSLVGASFAHVSLAAAVHAPAAGLVTLTSSAHG